MPRTRSLPRKLLFSLALTLGLLLALEGLASVVVALREARPSVAVEAAPRLSEEAHSRHDPELGWMNIPDLHIPDLYGEGVAYTTNSRAFRATREYDAVPPAGSYRVVCLGDSFTMGFGVGDHETFPARLEARSDELEVVNMGLGGFGIDQDYLWYLRDGVELQADLLLFCFIEDDFNRMRTDRFGGRFPKPQLKLEGDELRVLNVPVPRYFGESDSARRWRLFRGNLALSRLARDEQPFEWSGSRRVAEHVFADLARLSAERDQAFALVYLPTYERMKLEPVPLVRWLRGVAKRHEIPFLDLTPSFAVMEPEELHASYRHFPGDGHFTPAGNETVARALHQRLRTLIAGYPGGAAPDDDG